MVGKITKYGNDARMYKLRCFKRMSSGSFDINISLASQPLQYLLTCFVYCTSIQAEVIEIMIGFGK